VQPSRRQLLAGAAVVLSAACTDSRTSAPSPSASPAPPDPDVALTAAAVSREQALLALYDELLAQQPALRAELAPYRADHAAHLAALRPARPPSPTPTAGAPRASAARLRAAIATAERRTASAHALASRGASPDLARLLASLAACEASHAALL
jgi:hypothetical protein